jgi:RNA polymerase sigma-70 factor, ECF subfamily
MDVQRIDDAALVTLCASDKADRQVLGEFVRRYGSLVLQTVTWTMRRYCRPDMEECRDVFQDVFASLFENGSCRLKGYNPAKAGMGTYISAIARNAAINGLKKRKKENVELTENMSDEIMEIEMDAGNEELMEKIKMLVSDFTPNERLFYHLYFEECMPPETVAKVMGVSVDSVYSKKAKITGKIKKSMRNV